MTLGTTGARSPGASVVWSVEWGYSPAMQGGEVPPSGLGLADSKHLLRVAVYSPPKRHRAPGSGILTERQQLHQPLWGPHCPGVAAATPNPCLSPGYQGRAPPARPSWVRAHTRQKPRARNALPRPVRLLQNPATRVPRPESRSTRG